MDAQKVDRLIREATDNSYESGWAGLYNEEITKIETPEGTFEYVAQKDFGPTDTYEAIPVFVVVKFGDQYFQKEGTYSSWDGCNFYGECVEVEPYETPLTFYKRK